MKLHKYRNLASQQAPDSSGSSRICIIGSFPKKVPKIISETKKA
jgi:hypothetical protein